MGLARESSIKKEKAVVQVDEEAPSMKRKCSGFFDGVEIAGDKICVAQEDLRRFRDIEHKRERV